MNTWVMTLHDITCHYYHDITCHYYDVITCHYYDVITCHYYDVNAYHYYDVIAMTSLPLISFYPSEFPVYQQAHVWFLLNAA